MMDISVVLTRKDHWKMFDKIEKCWIVLKNHTFGRFFGVGFGLLANRFDVTTQRES